MSVLANPHDSQLLLINPVPECFKRLNAPLQETLMEQFNRLSVAADQAKVPRYFAVSSDIQDQESWLSTPCSKSRQRVFHFDCNRGVWTNTDLLNSMREQQREQLFICGFWLDDIVTAGALEAPTFGFNTHIVVNLSPPCDRRCRQIRLDRLSQHTIAPISLRNLLYEWMAKTQDDADRRTLEVLWERQVEFEMTGASQHPPEIL